MYPWKVKYLPYQAVIRDGHSSTELRVVFNASSKTVGPSLNDILYKGPCLTPLLFHVLLRFRFNPIGIIADIEKAYLQISVADCHRGLTTFLKIFLKLLSIAFVMLCLEPIARNIY